MDQAFKDEIFSGLSKGNVKSLKSLFEEKIGALSLSYRQVESILDIDRKTITNILSGETQKMDMVNLVKIGSFIGLNFSDTLKLFVSQLRVEDIAGIDAARRKTYIVQNFDLKNLKVAGFLDNTNDFDYIEERITTYFNLESIYDYTKDIGVAFSKAKLNFSNRMLRFWSWSAMAFFEKIANPNPFDRQRLIEVIPHIRPYCRDMKNGLRIVARVLFDLGITVMFQPYMPTTQVRGATFVVNGKPCIVITNRNKNYATLWFALMHELYHALFELDKIEKSVLHLTGELDLSFVDEDAANDFARQYFLSNEKSKYIFSYIDNKTIIQRYAEKNKIHPSLIYNFYCYDQPKDYWRIYNKYMPGTQLATENLNSDLITLKTIEEGKLSSLTSILQNHE